MSGKVDTAAAVDASKVSGLSRNVLEVPNSREYSNQSFASLRSTLVSVVKNVAWYSRSQLSGEVLIRESNFVLET